MRGSIPAKGLKSVFSSFILYISTPNAFNVLFIYSLIPLKWNFAFMHSKYCKKILWFHTVCFINDHLCFTARRQNTQEKQLDHSSFVMEKRKKIIHLQTWQTKDWSRFDFICLEKRSLYLLRTILAMAIFLT